jgi:hypothetical protein
MHVDRDTSEQDLVFRIWFGCLLEWQCQENQLKNWKKIILFATTQGFNSPFSFFLFGKKQKYNNNNNKVAESNHEVSSCYVLLLLLFSLSLGLLSAHPSSTLLLGHGCAFPCCIFTTLVLVLVLWPYSLEGVSYLQETESTPRNFLMYIVWRAPSLLYTWIMKHLTMLT